jgi:DNA helicase II / ATP-dependent DNA helicase PcrA
MPRVTASQVYGLVSKHQLTDEQLSAVEGASLVAPTLVIAGAGSGKTELMTVRIMYLVANGFATPEQILGLTFTKKAASELSARVLRGLYLLRESEFWPAELEQDFNPPTISTYNSFGNEIFRRNALAVGYEPDASVLSEASAVALARELILSLRLDDQPELERWEKSIDYLVERVLNMAGEMSDNLASAEQAVDSLQRFLNHAANLPKTPGGSMERNAYLNEYLDLATQNQLFARLAGKYRSLKQTRNLVDFSDQVALALEALGDSAVPLEYRFVMLDEYQDTSSIQTRLLAKLFHGQPVMAVGDPNQAIYGWRGASDANLSGFFSDFGSGELLQLSTCWRSGEKIVQTANRISEPLAQGSKISPVTLVASKQQAEVSAAVYQSVDQEALAAAAFFAAELSPDKTAALLMRTKAAMPEFVAALSSAGIPVEVTGLSGLMQLPEVIDLIAMLRVISSPQAATELIRILTGSRFAISPREIAKLAQFAKTLSRLRPEVDSARPVTLVEALDELRRESAREYLDVPEQSYVRIKAAAELFHQMRTRLSLSISELAWLVVRELELDIELFAHAKVSNPLVNLEQFISRLADYEATALRPSLAGLLQWLDYAIEHESFELPKGQSKTGVVQIMSVHASKGLEWDIVLVAQLNQGAFPIDGRESKGWLAAGKLPFELRGDQHELPSFSWEHAESQRDLKKEFDGFQDQLRLKHLREERRLAYVAVTRAAHKLRLTASYYKPGNKKPRAVSEFLLELRAAGLVDFELPDPVDENPLSLNPTVTSWPLPSRLRTQLNDAAQEVLSASPSDWASSTELALLIEERERLGVVRKPELPKRLSASALVQLFSNPEEFFESLRRPMPSLYLESASAGTRFHHAVEDFFSAQDVGAEHELEQTEVGASFLGSRFAALKAEYIEQEIQFVIAETVIVCKLDAVFLIDGIFQVVDWKSGKSYDKPELEKRKLQLALYRIGLAKWLDVGVEKIQASFFFAADGMELSPSELPSEAEIEKRLLELRKAHLD